MKFYAATLAALTVTTMVGCGNPATQVTAPQLGATAPGAQTAPAANAVANRKALSYTMGTFAATDRVVVRYKDDRKLERTSFGVVTRSLGLERTHVYSVKNAEERDALLAELKKDPNVEIAEPDYYMHSYGLSNDPQVDQQWGLTKIAMAEAWAVTKGSADVTVAVVDTGVDYNHPDLAGRVIKGKDFANNDDDPMDDQGHGTHCAGTIVANTGNGQGIAGMNANTKLLAVKVLGGDGSGSTSAIAEGINYAANNGADVISLSLGGPGESEVLKQAVNNAIAKGVVVVAAAGNEGNTRVNYPAGYENVIAVGATDKADTKTSFSTYGNWIDIAAPGDKILSTVRNGKYEQMSGTSMAGPHVAGAAALVLAKNPGYSVAQVRQALVSTGDAVKGFESAPSVRRLNVAKALGAAATPPAPETSPSPTPAPVQTPAPSQPEPPVDQPEQPNYPQEPAYPQQPQQPGYPYPGQYPQQPGSSLKIGNLAAANVGADAATIRWQTNKPAMGIVEYGTTPRFGKVSPVTGAGTTQTVTLAGLKPGTGYYYRVHAKDESGAVRVSYTAKFRTRSR